MYTASVSFNSDYSYDHSLFHIKFLFLNYPVLFKYD